MSREQYRYIKKEGQDRPQLYKQVDGEWVPWDAHNDRDKSKLDYSEKGMSIRFKGINDNSQPGF